MKAIVSIGLLACVIAALASDSEDTYCKSLLHLKKGYVCHCSEKAVNCFSVYIRRCPKGMKYYDTDLKMNCSCSMGFLNCIRLATAQL